MLKNVLDRNDEFQELNQKSHLVKRPFFLKYPIPGNNKNQDFVRKAVDRFHNGMVCILSFLSFQK